MSDEKKINFDQSQLVFPLYGDPCRNPQDGLTLRQLYAGLALQGMLANDNGWQVNAEQISKYAVEQADALLAALKG